MYIDIGATSQDEVTAAGVRPGDPIVPRADFVPMATEKHIYRRHLMTTRGHSPGYFRSTGAATCTSSQYRLRCCDGDEEVGLRGATTSVRAVDPDVAII